MGMTYRIDPERRLVLTRAWGVLTSRELADVMSRIVLDPRFDSTYRSLGDLRDVTDITIDPMDAAQAAAAPIFADGVRRAIVAPSAIAFGMARMFATFAERSGQDVQIFREMRSAEEWLEL